MADEADDASKQLDDIATGTKAQAFSDLADTISGVGDAMIGIVNDSKEYLQIMGQLEASSQRLGYSAGETEQVYTQLYGVLGDTQTAATATANLQALGLSQSDLVQMTELAIGAWAQYGDSIPIDSLAEAINETAQVGTVTGTFADALNWAGISEDDFNEKLQSTNSESERAQMIMDVLASQGLAGVAQGYRETNSALVESNEAQAKFDEAMSRLAEQIMPIVSEVMSAAADAIGKFVDWFQQLPEPAQNAVKVIGAVIAAITCHLWDCRSDWSAKSCFITCISDYCRCHCCNHGGNFDYSKLGCHYGMAWRRVGDGKICCVKCCRNRP